MAGLKPEYKLYCEMVVSKNELPKEAVIWEQEPEKEPTVFSEHEASSVKVLEEMTKPLPKSKSGTTKDLVIPVSTATAAKGECELCWKFFNPLFKQRERILFEHFHYMKDTKKYTMIKNTNKCTFLKLPKKD